MTAPLYIVGAGGHGHEVLEACRARDEELRFVVEWKFKPERSLGIAVFTFEEMAGWLERPQRWVVAVGGPELRRRLVQRVLNIGGKLTFATVFDPDCIAATSSRIGQGSQLLGGAQVGARARVGEHCIVNRAAVLCHDVTVGDFVDVGPGVIVGGAAVIDDDVRLGLGASVLPDRYVGKGAVIGAGAVVTTNVPAGETWVGVPARPIEHVVGDELAG